jgi:uncharacterized protein
MISQMVSHYKNIGVFTMKSKVYFGSAHQGKLVAEETLPAKLDLILNELKIRDRVKDELVGIKLHLGNNLGYSTIPPVFVRKVVQAVKDGGGQPFVFDLVWDASDAAARGYSQETLECPVYLSAGPKENYFYEYEHPFKNIKTWGLAGLVKDTTFLINFAHSKGHPSCSYGGNFKNLALGCMVGKTRSEMHDSMHFDPYWFGGADAETLQKIVAVCPHDGIVIDKYDPTALHLHPEQCNACGRCLKIAPPGSLKIDAVNFHAFQEACAISTSITLSTFEAGKTTNLNLATFMTPVCDCFGFTSMPILPDVGIFGSDDIVAIDQAVLDMIGKERLLEENVPTSMEVHTRQGHPLQWLHGPLKDPYKVVEYGAALGLGSREYELIDLLPVQKYDRVETNYISAR